MPDNGIGRIFIKQPFGPQRNMVLILPDPDRAVGVFSLPAT